jgi:ribose-phosphate pyrophosphokinase
MKDNRCLLFTGNASKSLGKEIANFGLDIGFGEIYHHQFPSGEWYCQLKENVRGADVFLLQAITQPANDNLMQLLIMADAARRASAGRITAIIPYLGYSRQDRKDKSRVPISAKLVMDIIEAAGINRVVTMDLHAQQIQGFTNLPFDHLQFRPTLANAIKSRNINVVVAPDTGAIKKALEFSEKEGMDFAFIVKNRKDDTIVRVTQFVGDVKGKNILVLDDLTESAGTLIEAAKECKAQGAKEIYCAVTHACLGKLGFDRLHRAFESGLIDHFYSSNTVITTNDEFIPDKATVVSVSEVFAKAIHGIHNNESISSLFLKTYENKQNTNDKINFFYQHSKYCYCSTCGGV